MALTAKTILAFLEYIFQFFINKALPASSRVDRQNFKDQKRIFKMKFNDGSFFFSSSFFLVLLFCFVFFVKHFHFLQTQGGRTYIFARWLCFCIAFFGKNDLTDFHDFYHP